MKAIILAGGRGTRLQPLTNDIPKPLVKIIDKPIMEHIILLLKKHGITDIGVTLGFKPEAIMNYFGDGASLSVNLTYFIENEPLGTAGSVKSAYEFLSENFLVVSGDTYTQIDLSKAIEFHLLKQSSFTIIATPHKSPVGLGILEIDHNQRVQSFVEKPSFVKPSLINCGMYVINKKILNLIPNGFYDFGKQLIPALVGNIYAYVTYDYWSDIGTLQSYYYTNYLIASELT